MERHGWCIQSSVKSVSFSANHWFVCIADLSILEIWSVRSICGRIYCELGFAPILRISPADSQGSVFAKKKKKNLRWWSYRVYYCPHVAYSKLFWFFIKHVGRPATLLQDNQDNADKSFSAGTNLPAQGHFIGMQCQAIPCRVRDFRQKLPTSFCQRGVQLSNTMCTSRNGPFMGATVLLNFGLSSWFIYQTLPLFVPEHC